MNGAEAMVKCLEEEGVTRIFGYPGVAISPFYEALYNAGTIEHVLVRQEQAAGHAASGYARISRKAAVCVTSSGPGATNLITALATAYADSIPLIAITGQVNSNLLGRDVFQEADMRGSTESFVKYSYLVKSADDIPRIFKEAFYIASTGRKGPVLIDIPCDVQIDLLTDYLFSCFHDALSLLHIIHQVLLLFSLLLYLHHQEIYLFLSLPCLSQLLRHPFDQL